MYIKPTPKLITLFERLDHETKMAKTLLNAKKIQEETNVQRHKQFLNELFVSFPSFILS